MTYLKIGMHSLADRPMVEIWEGDNFIGAIYPNGHRGIKVVSKFPMLVDSDASVAVALAVMINFGDRPP